MKDFSHLSHRRFNALTGDWVLVSPQRTSRPWQGKVEEVPQKERVRHDPDCYLCPGNVRVSGSANADYEGPYAFENDFPALSATACSIGDAHSLLRSEPQTGQCRVVCYSHEHDRHLVDMDLPELAEVLRFLAAECEVLDARPDIAYVQVFENRGAMMGASNPHPHAQIWATRDVPNEPARENLQQKRWYAAHGASLLLDYLAEELRDGARLLCCNEGAVSLVPFWAVWPFETLLMPRRAVQGPVEMTAGDWLSFADVLKRTLTALDALFGTPMPYSMGFHARPGDGEAHPEWQFHAHIYPPLLRSASIRKHMVGFEMLGMPQRDLTPESAARRLRDVLEGIQ
jgi:UDPglucose--hexose-1-phosphate uridylyltransferase